MEKIQIISILGSVVLLGIIVYLIKTKKLRVQYSLLWLLTGFLLLVFSIWRGLLDKISAIVGIYYPPSMLFLVGFLFLLMILLRFSVILSEQFERTKKIAQEISLLKERMEKLDNYKLHKTSKT